MTSPRRPLCIPTCIVGLAVGSTLTGCTQFNVDRLRVGHPLRQPGLAFPVEQTRRTDFGIAYFDTGPLDRMDAVVVYLTQDGRVAGKLHASTQRPGMGLGSEVEYQFVGDLDPTLLGLTRTGPIDTLRALAAQLLTPAHDPAITRTHHQVAAGIARLIDQWPNARPPAAASALDAYRTVPDGGTASITVHSDGVMKVGYEATGKR